MSKILTKIDFKKNIEVTKITTIKIVLIIQNHENTTWKSSKEG